MQHTAEKFNKNQLIIVLLLGILSALGPFSIDMYLPAFPTIAAGLNTSLDAVQLSLASYFIGISVGQLFYGPITDRFGRKKPLYAGLLLYTLAAIGCAYAANINQLIFFRLLQALGGCAGMVVSRAVVRDLFKPQESAKVFSMLMLVMGVAPIIAPSIGGFVAAAWGWRAIFTVLTGISIVTLALLWYYLPESKKPDKPVSLNIADIGKQYFKLLKNSLFIKYAMSGAFASGAMFAYISSAPFLFIEIFGFSEKEFSIIFSVNAAGLILSSQLNRVFLKYYSMEVLLKYATFSLMFFGILILVSSALGIGQLTLILFLFLFISSLGFIYPNSTALALADIGSQAGSASALLGALQMFVSFLISVAVSMLFNGTIIPVTIAICFCSILAFIILYFGKQNKRVFVPH